MVMDSILLFLCVFAVFVCLSLLQRLGVCGVLDWRKLLRLTYLQLICSSAPAQKSCSSLPWLARWLISPHSDPGLWFQRSPKQIVSHPLFSHISMIVRFELFLRGREYKSNHSVNVETHMLGNVCLL